MFSFGNQTGTSAATNNSLFPSSTTSIGGSAPSNPSGAFQFGGQTSAAAAPASANPFKFGSTPTSTSTPSSFNFGASSAPSTSTAGTFGSSLNTSSGNSFFNSASRMNPSPQVAPAAAPVVTSMATYPFQYIQQCFDPNHSNYRFRAFFYNVADDLTPAQRLERQTQKPANISDSLWAQVQNDNPDPSRMIPVLANGFNDLHARARWEDDVICAHTDKLAELNDKSSNLLRDLDIDLTAKLIAAQQRHQALSLRLLKIMKGMEILRRSGSKLSPAETQALTKLKSSLAKFSSGALESGSLHNLKFQLESLLESGRLDAFKSAKSIQPASEEASAALHSLLEDQQDNLKTLVESVQKDSSDLQIIKSGYQPL